MTKFAVLALLSLVVLPCSAIRLDSVFAKKIEDNHLELTWEKYNQKLDADLYNMAEGIQVCGKLLLSEPQLLFSSEVDLSPQSNPVTNLQQLAKQKEFGPPSFVTDHLRPSCAEGKPDCKMDLYKRGEAAMDALRGRKLLMTGDSSVRHTYLTLVCMMKMVEEPELMSAVDKTEAFRKIWHADYGKVCPTQTGAWCVGFPKYNAAIAYQWLQERGADDSLVGQHEFARLKESHRAEQLAERKRLAGSILDLKLSGNDIIALNIGFGYDSYYAGVSKLDNPTQFHGSSKYYEEEVRALMEHVMNPGLYGDKGLPQFVWMETTPQHWNTKTRVWNEEIYKMQDNGAQMDDQAIQHGANARNEIGNKIMAELAVPVIPLWKPLSLSKEMHFPGDEVNPGDYTHLKLDALLWICGQEADFISSHPYVAKHFTDLVPSSA